MGGSQRDNDSSPNLSFNDLKQKEIEIKEGSARVLGKPSRKKSAVFLNIVQKAFDPPPLSFEHYVVNFSEGILTKVRKRLSRQLSTK